MLTIRSATAGPAGVVGTAGDVGMTGDAGARGGGAATSGAPARAGSLRLGFRPLGGDGQLDVLKRWSHWPEVLAILRPIVLQETERAFW